MNEFEDKTKEQLTSALIGMEGYKQGCFDTFKIFEEIHNNTMKFYNQKIEECKKHLEKSTGKLY